MADWDPREHPRNPEDGRFVHSWAAQVDARMRWDRIRAMFPQGGSADRDRREDVLFAFDPVGGYRRLLTGLYEQFGVEPERARAAIEDYLEVLRPEDLERPKQPDDLDYGFSAVAAYLRNGEEARTLLHRIQAIQHLTGLFHFQETDSQLQDALIDFYGD